MSPPPLLRVFFLIQPVALFADVNDTQCGCFCSVLGSIMVFVAAVVIGVVV